MGLEELSGLNQILDLHVPKECVRGHKETYLKMLLQGSHEMMSGSDDGNC